MGLQKQIVHEGSITIFYRIEEYPNYFGEGKSAFDVVSGTFESDYLFTSKDEAINWIEGHEA